MHEEFEVLPPEVSYNHQKKKRRAVIFLLVVLAILCLILVLLLILTFVLRIHCPSNDSADHKEQKKAREEIKVEDALVHFIHVSDINLDMKYNSSIPKNDVCRSDGAITRAESDAPFGRIGCDTPVVLLNSSLEAMKNVTDGKKLEFVLISGKSRKLVLIVVLDSQLSIKIFSHLSDIS